MVSYGYEDIYGRSTQDAKVCHSGISPKVGQNHWLSPELTETMRQMVGFRNIVVHGYQSVDPKIMQDIVEHRLHDLLAFTSAITSRLQA